jgi:hypothetical protein
LTRPLHQCQFRVTRRCYHVGRPFCLNGFRRVCRLASVLATDHLVSQLHLAE